MSAASKLKHLGHHRGLEDKIDIKIQPGLVHFTTGGMNRISSKNYTRYVPSVQSENPLFARVSSRPSASQKNSRSPEREIAYGRREKMYVVSWGLKKHIVDGEQDKAPSL